MSMRVTITADVHNAKAADDFLDSFNEWVGHPEIEPLLLRVPHPFDPGATEAAYGTRVMVLREGGDDAST